MIGRLRGFARWEWHRLRGVAPVLALVAIVGGGVLALVLGVHLVTGIPTRTFMSDQVAVLEGPFYVGFVSVTGIMLWPVAASACLLTAAVLRRHAIEIAKLLAVQGFLSVLLWLDDAFLIHEELLPTYLGIPELATYGAYALAAGFVAWRFGRMVGRHPDGSLLILAVGFFGLAVVFDFVDLPWLSMRAFVEASSQLLGGLCWAGFALRASWRALATWVRPAPRAAQAEARIPRQDAALA